MFDQKTKLRTRFRRTSRTISKRRTKILRVAALKRRRALLWWSSSAEPVAILRTFAGDTTVSRANFQTDPIERTDDDALPNGGKVVDRPFDQIVGVGQHAVHRPKKCQCIGGGVGRQTLATVENSHSALLAETVGRAGLIGSAPRRSIGKALTLVPTFT